MAKQISFGNKRHAYVMSIFIGVVFFSLYACDVFDKEDKYNYPELSNIKTIQNNSDQDLLLRYWNVTPRQVYKLSYDSIFTDEQLDQVVEFLIPPKQTRQIFEFIEIRYVEDAGPCLIQAENAALTIKYGRVNKLVKEEQNWEPVIDEDREDGGGVMNCYFTIDNDDLYLWNFNNIIAGSMEDCNYNLVDDRISSSSGYDIPSNSETKSYDIDSDGLTDIEFFSFGGGGQGSYLKICKLIPSPHCKVFVEDQEDTYANILRTPLKMYENDVIDGSLEFSYDPEGFVLSLISPDLFTHPDSIRKLEGWNNTIDGYVAIELLSDIDTLYSWIRIDVLNYSTVLIQDYAVRK
jgi:hypothetical protein